MNPEAVHIKLNGDLRQIKAGTTVSALLRDLDIRQDRVAVEVNREILDRGDFDHRRLGADDQVEVISFIGGGRELEQGFHRLWNQ